MNNSIFANTATLYQVSERLKQRVTLQSVNQVYRQDSMRFGSVASPFQTYTASIQQRNHAISQFQSNTTNQNGNWCISDSYLISHEEVRPLLDAVQQKIDTANFLGMTDIEVYDWIEDRFVEAFGKDFRMAMYLGVSDPSSNCTMFNEMNNGLVIWGVGDVNGKLMQSRNFQAIGHSFYYALQMQFGDTVGGYNSTQEINRERLYGDMGKLEIMDNIRAKYPQNLTNRDLALMTSEMYSVGVLSFSIKEPPERLTHLYNEDGSLKRIMSDAEQSDIWLNMLDEPFNPIDIVKHYNQVALAGELNQLNFEIKDFALRYLGVLLRPDGLLQIRDFDIDININRDFSKMLPDLKDEYLNELERHHRELIISRERKSMELDRERARAIYEGNSLMQRRKANTRSHTRINESKASQNIVGI